LGDNILAAALAVLRRVRISVIVTFGTVCYVLSMQPRSHLLGGGRVVLRGGRFGGRGVSRRKLVGTGFNEFHIKFYSGNKKRTEYF